MIEHQYNDLCYLQFSHFLQFPNIVHGIFTRKGGYSPSPYHGLNTSTPPRGVAGDSVDNVVRNRALALQALGLADSACITLWQVHGADVVIFDAQDEWRSDWARHSYYEKSWTPEAIRRGDALLTCERGVALALSFADCAPILLYAPLEQVIGIAHGGWRGTARGIALAAIETMRERFGCQPSTIYAGIAPTIGPCCYEISEQVQQLFLGQQAFDVMPTREEYRGIVRESAAFSTRLLAGKSSLRLDLQTSNRNQLLLAGLQPDHIEVMEICTSCQRDRFFSHRGERGKTGRFPAILALV